jgi:hypothetical protein
MISQYYAHCSFYHLSDHLCHPQYHFRSLSYFRHHLKLFLRYHRKLYSKYSPVLLFYSLLSFIHNQQSLCQNPTRSEQPVLKYQIDAC